MVGTELNQSIINAVVPDSILNTCNASVSALLYAMCDKYNINRKNYPTILVGHTFMGSNFLLRFCIRIQHDGDLYEKIIDLDPSMDKIKLSIITIFEPIIEEIARKILIEKLAGIE